VKPLQHGVAAACRNVGLNGLVTARHATAVSPFPDAGYSNVHSACLKLAMCSEDNSHSHLTLMFPFKDRKHGFRGREFSCGGVRLSPVGTAASCSMAIECEAFGG
jgi:hypothetical protein